MHKMPESVPENLMAKSFLALPVKSLLRFRCLSKPWCAFIDGCQNSHKGGHQDFIKMHLEHSVKTKTNLHVIFTHWGISPPRNIQCLTFEGDDSEVLDGSRSRALTTLSNPFKHCNEVTEILGSCNGLLCLQDDTTKHCKIAIWNPFMRRYRMLPTLVREVHDQEQYEHFGFGYVELEDDYKVARLLQIDDHDSCEVDVYSLKLGSWRRINDFLLDGLFFVGLGFFVSGNLNWLLTSKDQEASFSVAVLNLGTEEFNVMTLPACFHGDESCNIRLEVVKKRLCVFEVHYQVGLDIWTMQSNGDEKTWFKWYSISEDDFLGNLMEVKVLACSRHGETLVLSDNTDIMYYDVKKKTSKQVMIHGMPDQPRFVAHLCFESLVSLGDNSEFDGKVT